MALSGPALSGTVAFSCRATVPEGAPLHGMQAIFRAVPALGTAATRLARDRTAR
jgi:hypothetical protein